MVNFVAVILCWTVTYCVCSEDKSHDIWLTRMEFDTLNPEWIINHSHKLHKVDRNRKALDLNFTFVKEMNEENVVCEAKFFQKNGGKYVKATFNIAKTPCCNLIDRNGLVWRCLREKSNFPESCPLSAGDYQLKDFDPDLCDYPKVLPPNGAEGYKVEFYGFVGPEQIWKHVGYGTLKKRIQIV